MRRGGPRRLRGRLAARARGLRSVVVILAAGLVTGCLTDRERPGPTAPIGAASLTARILEPRTGATVLTGVDITVRVEARDLSALYLDGVGFVARRVSGGGQLVDSASIRFAQRSDSTHEFTFRVPSSYPTNTQVDVYGIAFGAGGETQQSQPVHVVVVQCPAGGCL